MTATVTPDQLVAGLKVTIGGAPLDPIIAGQISELLIRDSLMLPASLTLRFSDPGAKITDNPRFGVGGPIVVSTAAPDDPRPLPMFTGKIAAMEPSFRRDGITLTLQAYDLGHVLTRSFNSRTFQFQSTSDIVRQVATGARLMPGRVMPTGVPHEFIQQSNESDWDFIWRLAIAEDFQFVVNNQGRFDFGPAGPNLTARPLMLRFGGNLKEFRPRVSIAQQPMNVQVLGADPRLGVPAMGMSMPTTVDSEPRGMKRAMATAKAMPKPVTVSDSPVDNTAQAFKRASAGADRLANTYVEADGETVGEPLLRAGTKAIVSQVGKRFNGTYTVTSTTHRFRAGRGYVTTFEVSGRSPRTLLELARGKAQNDKGWASNLVVGIVTQNVDPELLGRVRVRYPSLGILVESAWARLACLGAGTMRGQVMLPIPGEEVIIGFEHGDTKRPIVLGGLFNTIQRPSPEALRPDGPYNLMSYTDATITALGMTTLRGAVINLESAAINVAGAGVVNVAAAGAVNVAGSAVTLTSAAPLNIVAPAVLVNGVPLIVP